MCVREGVKASVNPKSYNTIGSSHFIHCHLSQWPSLYYLVTPGRGVKDDFSFYLLFSQPSFHNKAKFKK